MAPCSILYAVQVLYKVQTAAHAMYSGCTCTATSFLRRFMRCASRPYPVAVHWDMADRSVVMPALITDGPAMLPAHKPDWVVVVVAALVAQAC
jgi:hypothetical protein